MGLFDILRELSVVAEKNYDRQVRSAVRNEERKIDANQHKLDHAISSGKISKSSAAEYQKKLDDAKGKVSTFAGESKVSCIYNAVSNSSMRKERTKTVSEWDREWISIGMLATADLSPYSHCVGLYRHLIDGKTMYVGRAIELHNGGFRKRLSDYRRENDSARKHASGRTIHEHLNEIETMILIIGDDENAVAETKTLEGKFISKYNPPWNKQINI